MSYQISWLIPQHVILLELYGNNSLEEAREFDRELQFYLGSGTFPIHIIMDFSRVNQIPLRPDKIKEVQTFMEHPNFGWRILVGANHLIRFIAAIIFQMVAVRFRMIDSVDEAMRFLTENDESLKGMDVVLPSVEDE